MTNLDLVKKMNSNALVKHVIIMEHAVFINQLPSKNVDAIGNCSAKLS